MTVRTMPRLKNFYYVLGNSNFSAPPVTRLMSLVTDNSHTSSKSVFSCSNTARFFSGVPDVDKPTLTYSYFVVCIDMFEK